MNEVGYCLNLVLLQLCSLFSSANFPLLHFGGRRTVFVVGSGFERLVELYGECRRYIVF
jgi:hypothetical protein